MDSTDTGGSSYLIHVGHAAEAIAAGKCSIALITLAGKPRTGRDAAARPPAPRPISRPPMAHHPQRLRHVRHAPHARLRHHQRAAGLDQGRGLASRAVQSARDAEGRRHRRGRAELADDLRPAAPAGLLRRHRWRRRADRHHAGNRQEPEEAAGAADRPWRGDEGPARRQGSRPHLLRRRLVRPARVRGSRRDADGHQVRLDLRQLHHHGADAARGPRLLQEGRGRQVRRRRQSDLRRRQTAVQHRRRRAVQQPPGQPRRHDQDHRGGAAAARRSASRRCRCKNCDLAMAHGTGGLLGVRHAASTCILERA